MRCDAHPHLGIVRVAAAQSVDDREKPVCIVEEAPLAFDRGLAAETAERVEDRKMGDRDTGLPGRFDDAVRELRVVFVRFTVGSVMDIVELPDGRETCLQHVDIELGGDCLHMFRRQLSQKAVHDLAPGPETVVARTGHFRQPRHGPLKRVAVQVRHAGEYRTVKMDGIRGRGLAGLDLLYAAIRTGGDQDVVRPAGFEQSLRAIKRSHGALPAII